MSVEKCVVPNCNNSTTSGIPFPRKPELLEKWLDILGIPDFVPTPTSFVCIEHFEDGTLLENFATGNIPDDIFDGLPVPIRGPLKKEVTLEELEETLAGTIDEKCDQIETTGKFTINLVCRLCMSIDKEVKIDVFDKFEGKDITIATAITQCIPQIKIIRVDCFSKVICSECFNLVKQFHKFRETCLQSDIKLRESLPVNSQKRKFQETVVESSKKFYPTSQNLNETDERPVKIARRKQTYEKFNRVEAELIKALEGKLGKELNGTDNIIIEVQSDDDEEEQEQNNVLIPVGSGQIKLPKGIKVSINQAKIGICDATVIRGINNSEFCLVDKYVFEYRLCKRKIRHLKCLASKCRAVAQQTMTESGKMDNKVLIKVAHNHPPPSEEERKKQMFLHTMHRKMQSDKNLNFRSVYEDFCEQDPAIRRLVPLKTVINQICCQQMRVKSPEIYSFGEFYESIETDQFQKLHFTHANKQFYQEKFTASDGAKAVVFANCDTIEEVSDSRIMYVDASFKIETKENFKYHLVTILVWINDSYYPILFALVNEKSQEIYKAIFNYLHNTLAPRLRPDEIVTDYEASLYYSLGETYLESHIGGSVFYYTQNLYKKICSLNLSRELETNSCFRNIYHMVLMLPLLPVNTILDGLTNIEQQAAEMGQSHLTAPIFEYVKSQWIATVTPDLFCVHRLENRINENVIAPFKKLRDFLMLSKGKVQKQQVTIGLVVEKLIELEGFLQTVYSAPSKKSFSRDLSSSQKKNVIRAWQYIESHPKININNFFTKVLGYIKCMENQLWIWGFYRYTGDADDELINASNFSIVNSNEAEVTEGELLRDYYVYPEGDMVVDVVIDEKHGFLVKEENFRDVKLSQ